METIKKKLSWQMVMALVAVLVFAYGIVYAIVGTPKTCEQARENKTVNAVQDECIKSMKHQLDRIERKLDNYAKRNGDSK